MTDADSFGLRWDYAVAINLLTLFYARRVSQGYPWGWIRPNPNALDSTELQYAFRFFRNGDRIGFENLAPNTFKRNLGCDIDFGLA
jgi:hypothetical protein